jgi:hypothetical protein
MVGRGTLQHRTLTQSAEPVYRIKDQPFEIIVLSAVHQFGPFGFQPDLRKKPP